MDEGFLLPKYDVTEHLKWMDEAGVEIPLPDVSKAIEEAKYALDVLKADGIKLATNVDGQYLGAPELDTLFSVLNERKAVVILHPHRPEPVNKQVMQLGDHSRRIEHDQSQRIGSL